MLDSETSQMRDIYVQHIVTEHTMILTSENTFSVGFTVSQTSH